MENWFIDKTETKRNTLNAIMGEIDHLTDGTGDYGLNGNYWIDDTHNVYAFINDNGNDDKWIEVHYELYQPGGDGEFIGDITVLDTDTLDIKELRKIIITIVNMYYGDWSVDDV